MYCPRFRGLFYFNTYLPTSFFIQHVPGTTILRKQNLSNGEYIYIFPKKTVSRPFTFPKICVIMDNAKECVVFYRYTIVRKSNIFRILSLV